MNLPRNANFSPLDGLPEEAVVDFISHAKSQTFAKGEIILEQGAAGDKLFLIVSGRVSVSVSDTHADTVSTRRIAMLGAGEIFGESAVLANDTRTATVKAATFVDTLAVSATDYQNLVAKHPMLQQNVCRILGKRMASPKHQADSSNATAAMSIAVVIENAMGWEVARAISRELNGWSSSCKPMVLASTRVEAEQRHRESPVSKFDVQPVAHESLPACVASGVATATPIVIAMDPQSAAVAAQECDQVIMLADAESTSSWVAQFSRRLAPGNHILARMFRQTSAVKPYNCPANVRELRFKTSENLQLNSDAITRLLRAIRGQRIGLALGGGGARGIAHIGVLEVLAEEGIVFDQVAGTSAGAIVGAAYASGIPMSSVAEMYRRDFVPPRLLAKHPFGRRLFLMGAFRGNRLEQIFRSNLDSVQFDQLEIPLSINAADLISGKSIVRESGDVVRAILESINHPVFGRPIMTSGQAIVDGGILGNVPAAALSGTCDRVISVDVGSRLSDQYGRTKDGGLRRPSYLSTVLRSIDVSKKHTSRSHQIVSDYVITPEVQGYRLEDFHATDALIEIGRQAALASLTELKEALEINEPSV